MWRTVVGGLLFCLWLAPAPAAEIPPDDGRSVVLLVNAACADSRAVAEHYARRRGVPDANILTVRTTTSEVISRQRFDRELREPLRQFLLEAGHATAEEDGRLSLKVKYLVSTYGIPVKIREDYREAEAR